MRTIIAATVALGCIGAMALATPSTASAQGSAQGLYFNGRASHLVWGLRGFVTATTIPMRMGITTGPIGGIGTTIAGVVGTEQILSSSRGWATS
jgi:hypothetical protein